jgi:hypothetical protein
MRSGGLGNMKQTQLSGQRLAAVFLLGFALFNFPVLSLFDRPGRLFGLPLLYAYLFLAWLLLIAIMALLIERRGS